jgi:transglutaminase/protease-like cytokinesis protein 3
LIVFVLFYRMAGVPCVIISGMNKSAAYEVGSKVDRKMMGAQWNAVYIDGEWRFIDAFWAKDIVPCY